MLPGSSRLARAKPAAPEARDVVAYIEARREVCDGAPGTEAASEGEQAEARGIGNRAPLTYQPHAMVKNGDK